MRTIRIPAFPSRRIVAALAAAGLFALASLATAAEAPKPATAAKPAPAAKPAAPAAKPTGAPAAAPAAAPSAAPQALDPAKIPAVVARVNGYEIKKETLLAQAGGLLQRGTVPTVEFYRAVVDQMVGTRLLFEESVAHKLLPTDEEVNQAYATVRQRFQGTDEEFAKRAAENGMTIAELKQGMRENMAIRKLVSQEIQPKIVVSDADAQKFYDQNSERMQRPEQVNVSHILIGLKQGATDAEKAAAKKKAEDLLAKLKAGGDFAQLAKDNSDDGSKAQGGDLGWVSKGTTVPPFDTAAFALKPGETSGVVESQFGFHIIRVKEHRPSGKAPFEEAKAQITSYLKDSALRDALTKHVTELRANAKVEVAI